MKRKPCVAVLLVVSLVFPASVHADVNVSFIKCSSNESEVNIERITVINGSLLQTESVDCLSTIVYHSPCTAATLSRWTPEVLPFKLPQITGGSDLRQHLSIKSLLGAVKKALIKRLVLAELETWAKPRKHLAKWIPYIKAADRIWSSIKVAESIAEITIGYLNREKRIRLESAVSFIDEIEDVYLILYRKALTDRMNGNHMDKLQSMDEIIDQFLNRNIRYADEFRSISGLTRYFTNQEDLQNAEQVYQALVEIKKRRPSAAEWYLQIRNYGAEDFADGCGKLIVP